MKMNKKRHIILIDPLEKLNIKKDSTLFFALELQKAGMETFLLFEEDFFMRSQGDIVFRTHGLKGKVNNESYYVDEFELSGEYQVTPGENDIFHMRLDPPFDTRYLRYLWMLRFIEDLGVQVINAPQGILKYNEKITAYQHPSSLKSFVGSSLTSFLDFCHELRSDGNSNLIIKPLDLYQGIGVQKVSLSDEGLERIFQQSIKDYKGPVVAQPFFEGVIEGEIRSIFYDCKELGSILKIPQKGEFLANIAQGAQFAKVELNPAQAKACLDICQTLKGEGVPWVAFDILGDYISEVNITCPGLLVEVANAMKKNLALDIIISSY